MDLNSRLETKIVTAQREAALECVAANDSLIAAMEEEVARLRKANEAILCTLPPGSEPEGSISAFAKGLRPATVDEIAQDLRNGERE